MLKIALFSSFILISKLFFAQDVIIDGAVYNYHFREKILGVWYNTDSYGNITDSDGDESWGFTDSITRWKYEFIMDTLIVTNIKTDEKSFNAYRINHDSLIIEGSNVFYVAYINEELGEFMLFFGYQNTEHQKFNRNIAIKTKALHSMSDAK